MLDWEVVTTSAGLTRWHIMHDGEHLDGTDYTTDAVRMAHHWIADDPAVAGEYAENVMKDINDAGLLVALSITEIADFLIDWSSTTLWY